MGTIRDPGTVQGRPSSEALTIPTSWRWIMDTREKQQAILALEELENRWVPASISFYGGNLNVTNIVSNQLTVMQDGTTANKFSVQDGAGSKFTFQGVSNITINDVGPHNVTVDTNGNNYTGNLIVNVQNGSDTVGIVNSTGTGAILGNVTLTTKFGSDTVSLGTNFFGSLTLANSNAISSLTVGSPTIKGALSITGIPSVTITSAVTAIKGGLSIQDGGISSSTITIQGGSGAGTMIGNYLNITGGSLADSLTIGSGNITVNGNTSLTLGQGSDTFSLSSTGSVFNGSFSFTSGAGADTVTKAGGNTFNGSVGFNLGNGTDTLTLGTDAAVNGNLSITEGNGNALITVNTAVVNGNLIMSLGQGSDTVSVANSPSGGLGTFFLTALNGNNSVTINPAAAGTSWNINFNFGTGANTVTLSGSALGTVMGSISAPFGGPYGDVFNQNGWTLGSPWSMSNFQ